MSQIRQVTWQPILHAPGVSAGIALDATFAQACENVPITDALRTRALRYVWGRTKPDDWAFDYVPTNILWFDNETLLLTMVQRYSDHGKWLNIDNTRDVLEDTSEPVVYAYHHAGVLGDNAANKWLEFAFMYWVRFAHIVLQEQGSEYQDIL